MAIYDRLVGFGDRPMPEGHTHYDHDRLVPELAESFEVAPDGKSVLFTLREGATFHSGNPLTAEDVKWSLDRAIALPGFPRNQMAAGSLIEPSQIEVVDARRVRVHWVRPDKLLLPNLAVAIPCIYDSKLLRERATVADPWAVEFARADAAGGGAFKLVAWRPGQETILERFANWKSGTPTNVQRIIIREVPSAGTRRALIERGDADVLLDLPPKDFAELAESPACHGAAHADGAHVALPRHEHHHGAVLRPSGAAGRRLGCAVRRDLPRRPVRPRPPALG